MNRIQTLNRQKGKLLCTHNRRYFLPDNPDPDFCNKPATSFWKKIRNDDDIILDCNCEEHDPGDSIDWVRITKEEFEVLYVLKS